jgi:GxxExxY protein
LRSLPLDELNRLTEAIIAAAIAVHKFLGPGLLESTYEACLVYELQKRGFKVRKQVELPVIYDGILIDCAYRIDVVVEEAVVLELKAVEAITKLHEAQLISYLKLSDARLGLIINFNVLRVVDGVRRIANRIPD